jgi:hypothetical protein
MTDSTPTTATKKTPVASTALAAGLFTGVGAALLGYFDKTGLSRLLVELGGGTSALTLLGTFAHQIGLAKYGKDAEEYVKEAEDRFDDIESELVSLWNHVEEVKSAATAPVYPTTAAGATVASGPTA